MKKYLPFIVAGAVGAVFASLVAGLPAIAGSIKTWANGEVITSTDLNSNFNHIHNAAEGSLITSARLASNSVTLSKMADSSVGSAEIVDGAIVNADISASAAIVHSKLAVPAYIAKALWVDKDACGAGACTAEVNGGVTSVTGDGSGTYTVVIPARTDANYGVLVSPIRNSGHYCYLSSAVAQTTTGFTIECFNAAGANNDSGFTFMLFDNDN